MASTDQNRKEPGRWPVLLSGALVLLALAALPYVGSVDAPLLYDDRTLLDNRWLVGEAGAASVWSHDYWHGTRHEGSDLYRPLTVLGLAWNLRAIPTPTGIRGVNLLLHGLTAAAVWWALTQLFLFFGEPERKSRGAAWIAAALFAVHPLASEAVLFAVGRAELLAAGLSLAAFAVALHGHRSGQRWIVLLSALPFGLALAAKESAAAWLAVLVVWAVLRGGKNLPGRLPAYHLAGWGAVFLWFLIVRGRVVGWGTTTPYWVDNPLALVDPVTRFGNACLLFGRYLAKMVWPRTLSVHYEFDQLPLVGVAAAVAAGLAITATWVGLGVLLRRRSDAAAFLWYALPAAFAITGNFFLPIGTIFAERLAYLPLAIFCGLVVTLAGRLPLPRKATWLVVVVLLAALAFRGGLRGQDLQSKVVFVEAEARSSPRSVKALANLGRTRMRTGRIQEAIEPLETAVALWPDYRRALLLLADAYGALGDVERERSFRVRAEQAEERRR